VTDPALKQKISLKLDRIVVARLFGDGSWLADSETGVALSKTFFEMGLQEAIPGELHSWHLTDLGTELNLDLLMVFMGLFCESDIPYLLKKNALIDEPEVEAIYDALEAGIDPERLLRTRVQQAYVDYYNPSKRRH
jgi:hypothetical protein